MWFLLLWGHLLQDQEYQKRKTFLRILSFFLKGQFHIFLPHMIRDFKVFNISVKSGINSIQIDRHLLV